MRYAGTDAGRVVLEVPRERRETVGLRPTLEALPIGLRVLLVEDDADVRRMTTRMLRLMG